MLFTIYNNRSIPPFGTPLLNRSTMFRHILDRTSGLKGWTKYEPIIGGAMNRNYKVEVDGKQRVLRILNDNPELKINRKNEIFNLDVAYESNLAPMLIDCDLDNNIIVTEYIEGKTVTNEDLQNKYFAFKVIEKMKELHSGPEFLDDFNVIDKFNEYYSKCINNNYKLPKAFTKNIKHVNKISEIIKSIPKMSVPCHNDLWAPNIILTKDNEIKFIDYEFSGNNDPLFEIGNFWNESDLSYSVLQDIVRHYYGQYCNRKTAIAELYSIYVNCMWVLWGTIQSNTSKIDYDYEKFINDRLEKALPKLNKKYLNKILINII